MAKCKGPHHDLDDFTTYDLTTFTTLFVITDNNNNDFTTCDRSRNWIYSAKMSF